MGLMNRRGCAVAATSLALLVSASAAAAPGDTVYTGATADGNTKVKLVVASPGQATTFKIANTTAECKAGSLDTEPATFRRFDTSDPGEFSDKRKATTKDGQYVLKDTFLLAGTINADQASWSGTYQKTTKVLKNGRKFDTCVLSTTWDVS
jgi:hypothetical protein